MVRRAALVGDHAAVRKALAAALARRVASERTPKPGRWPMAATAWGPRSMPRLVTSSCARAMGRNGPGNHAGTIPAYRCWADQRRRPRTAYRATLKAGAE
jgi:hypothetical protein